MHEGNRRCCPHINHRPGSLREPACLDLTCSRRCRRPATVPFNETASSFTLFVSLTARGMRSKAALLLSSSSALTSSGAKSIGEGSDGRP